MTTHKSRKDGTTSTGSTNYGIELGTKYRSAELHARIAEEELHDRIIQVEWDAPPPTPHLTEAYRLSPEQAAAWPLPPPPKNTLSPKRGYAVPHSDTKKMQVAIVAIFGHQPEQIRKFLRQIEMRQGWGRGFLPIFFTDSLNQSIFRHAGYNLELFPASTYGALEHKELFAERFLTLRKKWGASVLIDLSHPGFLRDRIDNLEMLFVPTETRKKQFSPHRQRPEPAQLPALDLAALRAEYYEKGLNRRPNRFALYRILGNDLPPRHKIGQTLENLRFLLENEKPLPNVSKRWVVNRIVNPEQDAAICALLEDHNQPYIHIPFDLDEYAQIDWDIESFPQPGFFLRGKYLSMKEYDQGLADYHLRRFKNQYVINNNGARNVALRDGRERAKWVLPWDGNCFFTPEAWAEIAKGIEERPYYKYVVVPMARIMDNKDLLKKDFRPDALEEPQLIFRCDAEEEFNEEFFYGRRPKVEIFWRLGIPGNWDRWPDTIWDVPRLPVSDDAKTFGTFGWVARLYSGQGELEVNGHQAMRSRGMARVNAVEDLLDHLDAQAMHRVYDPKNLTAYDEEKIQALASAPAGTAQHGLFERLQLEASLALQRGPYSVTHKRKLPASGDPNDYFNPAPYWWPNPDTPTGIPFVFRDGERIPGTRLYEPDSDDFDRTRLQRMFDDTTVLALAWKATGQQKFINHAANLVRTWFIAEETRMNPHLRYSQPRSQKLNEEGSKSGVIEMKDLYYLLDAVRLIEQSGCFSADDQASFRSWLDEYLEWLSTAEQAIQERRSSNNHGTCYDLQTGAIAAFLGDDTRLRSTFRTSRERLLEQFTQDGEQPHEMKRTQTAHYCCFNLQCWLNLITLADRCGDRLLCFEGQDGRGLAQAFQWLLPYMTLEEWPFEQIEPFDRDRFLPLFFAAKSICGLSDHGEMVNSDSIRPMFFPHDGIKPFWMLGPEPRFRPDQETWEQLSETLVDLQPQLPNLLGHGTAGAPTLERAKDLEKKLWNGFSQSAVSELETARLNTASDHRLANNASRSLARWHYVSEDWDRVAQCLDTMHDLSPAKERERLLIMIDTLTRRGEVVAAYELALAFQTEIEQNTTDILLLRANLSSYRKGAVFDSAVPIDWINKIYLAAGLTTYTPTDERVLNLTNLSVEGSEFTTWGGDLGALVSVILPLGPSTAPNTHSLQSLLAQAWRNIEVLVTGARKDIQNLSNQMSSVPDNVKFVETAPGQSLASMLNSALVQAKGEFVTIQNPDQIAHPEKIAAQVNGFRSNKIMSVTCSQALIESTGQIRGVWSPGFSMTAKSVETAMYRTEAVMQLGGWDPVNSTPVHLMHWRLTQAWGDKSVSTVSDSIPLLFTEHKTEANAPTHVQFPFGVRRDSFRRLARQVSVRKHSPKAMAQDTLNIPFVMAPLEHREVPLPKLDTVVIGDYTRDALGLQEVLNRLHHILAAGQEVGLLNWPDYGATENELLDERIADLIDYGALHQVSAGTEVKAESVVLSNPYLLNHRLDGLPDFAPKRITAFAGPPLTFSEINFGHRRHLPTTAEIEERFGAPCTWVSL